MAVDITTPQPKKPRRIEIDKRQAIIDVARELFTTVGYEVTTIADVARKAGVAVGTVYLYFKNKNDLLYAICLDWEREFVQFMTQPGLQTIPHHLRARPLVQAVFDQMSQNREMVQVMGMSPHLLGTHHAERKGNMAQLAVQAFFEEAVAVGAFRPIDARAAAIVAYGMVEQALEQCFDVEGGQDQQRYIDILVDAFEHWLVRPELLQSGTTLENNS